MNVERPTLVAPICLVVGAVLGLGGSFPPLASLRGLAWGAVALLLAATAVLIFAGRSLTPLSEPLPFFAYSLLVLTLLGWAWWCRQPTTAS